MKSFFFFCSTSTYHIRIYHTFSQTLLMIYQFCCCGFPIYIVYTTKCERARLEALANGPLLGQFVPHCRDDGSYEPAQCWASTGYCWCVDQNGERKADSMVRFKYPVCL